MWENGFGVGERLRPPSFVDNCQQVAQINYMNLTGYLFEEFMMGERLQKGGLRRGRTDTAKASTVDSEMSDWSRMEKSSTHCVYQVAAVY